MKFRVEDFFHATVEEIERELFDPALFETLARVMPAIERIDLLEQHDSGDTVERRVRYTPRVEGRIPAFGRNVVKPEMLEWVEASTYHRAERRFVYRITPNLPARWADRFESHGAYQLLAGGDGTRRIIDGEVIVRVPLLGRTVEKLIIREVESNFRAEASALARLLFDRRV